MMIRPGIAVFMLLALAACEQTPAPESSPDVTRGFAGLGTSAADFTSVEPTQSLRFPEDHGAHPGFRIEWWYVTANLQDNSGKHYGVQWTLFRQALVPQAQQSNADAWLNGQVWMAHAALTTEAQHAHSEQFGRSGGGQAGVTIDSGFRAWLDNALLESRGEGGSSLDQLTLQASGEGFSYRLDLESTGPIVRHGDNGFSRKSERGQASWYISQPFYEVAGELTQGDGTAIDVNGQAWLDHEWSSQPLAPDQSGWDWFSLHLKDGGKVMLFRLRDTDNADNYYSGTWITDDGTAAALAPDQIRLNPTRQTGVAGRDVPTEWHINVPEHGLDATVAAVNPDSWMDGSIPYWEGPVHVSGSHTGRGYLEMTGY